MDDYVSSHHLNLTPAEKLQAYNDSFDLSTNVNTSLDTTTNTVLNSPSSSAISPNIVAPPGGGGYTNPQFTLKYTCFIPTQYISNPWDAAGTATYAHFGGDNRGFNPYATSFRTRSTVNAGFTSFGESISMTPEVGTSHGYNSSYQLIGQKTASTNGITMTPTSISSSEIDYTVNHSVGNPLTLAPAIDYSYSAALYSGGGVSANGWHDQAPDHELYIYSPYFTTVHQATVVDYLHLFPEYPKNYWSYN